MSNKDFDLFKQNYLECCKTKSTNQSVLGFYKFILENEKSDSDFWTSGSGFDELVDVLKPFNEEAWNELRMDLQYWTIPQLVIFTEGILVGNEFQKNFDALDLKSIQQRYRLIPLLLDLAKAKGGSDIALHVFENIDVLLNRDYDSIEVLERLLEESRSHRFVDVKTGLEIDSPNVRKIELALDKREKFK